MLQRATRANITGGATAGDKITRAINTITGIIVNGPDNRLDFSYVSDVASAFTHAAIDPQCANEIYNCTRGHGRRIIEAAELIQSRIPASIELAPHDSFYPNRDTLNSEKLQVHTDWQPKVDIEYGIPRYLDWFLAQKFINQL